MQRVFWAPLGLGALLLWFSVCFSLEPPVQVPSQELLPSFVEVEMKTKLELVLDYSCVRPLCPRQRH